jgi:hypothetical protein
MIKIGVAEQLLVSQEGLNSVELESGFISQFIIDTDK